MPAKEVSPYCQTALRSTNLFQNTYKKKPEVLRALPANSGILNQIGYHPFVYT
jgi:hypothetical protein